MLDQKRLVEILRQVKQLAQEYHQLTGKPLGVTGEVAEVEARDKLNLTLAAARQAGYDATELKDGVTRRLQIKGRRILDTSKRSQRVGSIRTDNKEWDAVLPVLLDDNFDAVEIWEAPRDAIIRALKAPGSKARNERGALAVSRFKAIQGATLRWPRGG